MLTLAGFTKSAERHVHGRAHNYERPHEQQYQTMADTDSHFTKQTGNKQPRQYSKQER